LRSRGRALRWDARVRAELLDVPPPSAIDVGEAARGTSEAHVMTDARNLHRGLPKKIR
jgi:hypothetical protein